jgi:hypothetical protein
MTMNDATPMNFCCLEAMCGSEEKEHRSMPWIKGTMRLQQALVVFAFAAASIWGQVVVVTSPTANQSLSGPSFTMTCSVSTAPSAATVQWFVDGDPQQDVSGNLFTPAQACAMKWNTFFVLNGTHSVWVVLQDALGATLATSSLVSFTTGNSYPNGSIVSPAALSLAVTTGTPVTSTWSGTVSVTATTTGTSNTDSKTLCLFIDGMPGGKARGSPHQSGNYCQSGQGQTSPLIYNVDTTVYANGQHWLLYEATDQTVLNQAGGYGQWGAFVTFNNGAHAMELRVTPQSFPLSSTQQLTAVIVNTDGSISTNPSVTWTSLNTAACTVNSSGLVTYVAFGTCEITAASGTLPVRITWGRASLTNTLPHLGTDGQVHTSYAPGQSFWLSDMFVGCANCGLTDPTLPTQVFASLFSKGFNTIDVPCINSGVWGTSAAAFHSAQSSYVSAQVALLRLANPALYGWVTCTGIAGGSHATYPGVFGAPASYTTPGFTDLWQQWGATGLTLFSSLADEVNNDWFYPIPHPVVTASCPSNPNIDCFTSITSTGTGTCTVNWTHYATNGTHDFGIFGATTNSALNTTIGGTKYNYTSTGTNTFTFAGAACNSTFTANAASDPSMRIEPLIDSWEAGNTDYFHYNGLSLLYTMLTAPNPRPLINWPTAGISNGWANYHWMGDPTFSDYAQFYFASSPSSLTPIHGEIAGALPSFSNSTQGYSNRYRWGDMQGQRAWIGEANGTTTNWGNQGFPLTISSISGNIVTFASSHGVPNMVPDVTRGWICNATGPNAAYYGNGGTCINFFIDATPTATTAQISLAVNSATLGTGGMITFPASGRTLNIDSISSGSPGGFGAGTCPANGDLGSLFTISGNSQAYFNTSTFWLMAHPWNGTSCNTTLQRYREVPPASFSATGGTMYVVRDNNLVIGEQGLFGAGVLGPRIMFDSIIYAGVMGSGGIRAYGQAPNWNTYAFSYPRFQDTTTDDNQAGLHPVWTGNQAGQVSGFYAAATANQLNTRMAKYLLQPFCVGAPDLGLEFEETLRCGSSGNLLIALNMTDYPQTRTADLTACVVNGQPTLRYMADWRGIDITVIAAGTTSDTATFKEGGAAYYVCSKNAAAEYSPPLIGAKLADVPNAAKILIRYAYQSYLLPTRVDNAVDCGTGTCTIPVDRQLGPITYVIVYLNSSGATLATSDAQIL